MGEAALEAPAQAELRPTSQARYMALTVGGAHCWRPEPHDRGSSRSSRSWLIRRSKPFDGKIMQQFTDHELTLAGIDLPDFEPARFDDRDASTEIRNETAGIDDDAGLHLPSTRTMGMPNNDKSGFRTENAGQIGG